MRLLYIIGIFCALVQAVSAGKIYWTDRAAGTVQRSDFDGKNVETLLTLARSNLRGIAIDVSSDHLYFADNGSKTIRRLDIKSGESRVLVTGLGFPADVTLDLEKKKIYWCDQAMNRIQRSNLDGSGKEDVLPRAAQPYYLDLDPENQQLYWGDFMRGQIWRSKLDGSETKVFIGGLTTVRQVELDHEAQVLYWCDRNAHKIQRRPIKGGKIEDLYTDLDTPHGMTLDVPAGKIYWADTGTNNHGTGGHALVRGNMDGSGDKEILVKLSQPWDVVLDIRSATFDAWGKRFQRANETPLAADNDTDGDGWDNVVEYALGMNPFVKDKKTAIQVQGDGKKTEMTFHRQRGSQDLTLDLEYADAAKEWISLAAEEQILSPLDDATEVVRWSAPDHAGLRLKISLKGSEKSRFVDLESPSK